MMQLRSLPKALPQSRARQFLFRLPLSGRVAEMISRRQIRRSYCRLSDALLGDVGLTTNDLSMVLALPLTQSAAEALGRVVSDKLHSR